MEPRFVENGEYPRRKRSFGFHFWNYMNPTREEEDKFSSRGGGGYREASMKTSHLAKSAKRENPFRGPGSKRKSQTFQPRRRVCSPSKTKFKTQPRRESNSVGFSTIPFFFHRRLLSKDQRPAPKYRDFSKERGEVRTKHFKFTIVRNFSFPTKDRETFPNSGFSGWMSMEKIDPGFIAIYIRFKIGFAILPSFSSLKFFLAFL